VAKNGISIFDELKVKKVDFLKQKIGVSSSHGSVSLTSDLFVRKLALFERIPFWKL